MLVMYLKEGETLHKLVILVLLTRRNMATWRPRVPRSKFKVGQVHLVNKELLGKQDFLSIY